MPVRRPARSLSWAYAVVGLATSLVQAAYAWEGAIATSVVLWGLVLAIVAWALATVVRALSWGKLGAPVAATVGSFAMISFVTADTLHVRLQQRHMDFAALRFTYQALRTHVVKPTRDDLILLVVGGLLLAALLALLFRFAARLPRLRATSPASRRARPVVRMVRALPALAAALVVLALFTRDLVFRFDDPRAAPLFWNAPMLAERAETSSGALPTLALGSSVIDAEMPVLDQLSTHPESWTVSARQTPSILFVHVESLRHDMFNATSMPKTFAWRDRCAVLPHHYSSGNHTSTAMLGVMTGLNGAYDVALRTHKTATLPLIALAKLGYELHVWSANETLDLDDMRRDLFGEQTTSHVYQGDPVYLADREIVAGYQATLSSAAAARPRFDYLVLDSSHYDYQYPPELAIHQPTATLTADFDRRTGEGKLTDAQLSADPALRRGIYNRYQNSVLFVDAEVDQLLSALDGAGKLASTLVVVFGDHGEAFWDRNETFGHSSALDEPQTHVPLLLCTPQKLTPRYTYSSHADLFPTVFGLMGLTSSAPFMTGKSLATYDASLDFAVIRSMLVGTTSDPRLVLVMDGMKLGYYLLPTPLERSVTTEDDQPWRDPPADRLGRLMAATVSANLLR